MTDPKPALHTPTKCKLCGQVFSADIMHSATLLAQTPQEKAQRVQQLMAPLMKHLEQVHSHPIRDLSKVDQSRNFTQLVELQVANYRGLLLLDAFETSEPLFLEQREMARGAMFRKMQKVHVSDERISERVHGLLESHKRDMEDGRAVMSELPGRIIEVLKQLRDALEERTPHRVDTIPTPNISLGAN